ncbi:hypothetical protein D9619_002242 [Psilocybe cf. subviscida]|uniref:Exoribonuclease phosphorolytic domain-containing protein n=1 Tax=Psilocybe cf. subviscida TaxID=2480587 RepID=A0A8H5BE95_9AGAR|nr:hypothetical protein D9619_002242 [Psilocybe cf. subviscida]
MSSATRLNGRRNDETRPLTVVFEGLARVDGSARFGFGAFNYVKSLFLCNEQILTICTGKTPRILFICASTTGTTSALASLSGPIEVRLANELPNKATFEVLVRPLANISATDAKATASTLKAALEPSLLLAKHPRTLVQLVVQSLSAPLAGSSSWGSTSNWEGSSTLSTTMVAGQWKDVLLLPAMINASSLALLNASSVPMRGVAVAVSVGRFAPSAAASPSQSTLVLDPSEDEAAQLQAGGCFAFLFADGAGLQQGAESENGDCVWSSWKALSGGYDEEELFAARSLAQKGARELYKRLRARMAGQEEQEVEERMAADESRADLVGVGDDDDKMEI